MPRSKGGILHESSHLSNDDVRVSGEVLCTFSSSGLGGERWKMVSRRGPEAGPSRLSDGQWFGGLPDRQSRNGKTIVG